MMTLKPYFTRKGLVATIVAVLAATGSAHAQQLAANTSRAAPKQVDRIIAIVNDDIITQTELTDRVELVTAQLRQQNTPLPNTEVLMRQVLERMIADLVQLSIAKEQGIKIDDGTIERAIGRIAEENNTSISAFREQLEKDGIRFSRFREDVRRELVISRLREREVESQIVVTDTEVDNQLAQDSKDIASEQEYRLQHVLVLVPQNATAEQIEARRRRAMAALSEIRKGTPFAQVAASFSEAQDALQGGNLGWRPSSKIPSLFLDAIERLQPGEASDILKSPNGFHIVRVAEKRGKTADDNKVAQTRVRHILIRNKDTVTDEDAKQRLSRLRERIIGGTDFSELAKVHSEDGTSQKGGDLGWISPGETVPEFERVVNQMRDNEISQPFQTQFGWHLVQVMGRRTEDISDERRRQLARNTVRARKSDEAYAEWLRRERDRAFVEVRLEDKY